MHHEGQAIEFWKLIEYVISRLDCEFLPHYATHCGIRPMASKRNTWRWKNEDQWPTV